MIIPLFTQKCTKVSKLNSLPVAPGTTAARPGCEHDYVAVTDLTSASTMMGALFADCTPRFYIRCCHGDIYIINTMTPGILPLFALPLYHGKVQDTSAALSLAQYLQQSSQQNTTNRISTVGTVLDQQILQGLREEIQQHQQQFLRALGTDQQLRITNSWFNYTEQGQSHHIHHHHNSVISGTVYLQCSGEDCIEFINPHSTLAQWDISQTGPWVEDQKTVAVCPGMILLWPSQLLHLVPKKTLPGMRISLSWNTWPLEAIGRDQRRTQVVI